MNQPLADKMRPASLRDFLGQEELIGKDKLLNKAIQKDQLPSIIFWGPPGSGKTTLAYIIAQKTKADFQKISAVSSGKKDLRKILERAEQNQRLNIKTILFIDEIHRWNKAQQDALLPYVEQGLITLIGATTENPSFEIISALLSRCRVFVLNRLEDNHIQKILAKAARQEKIKINKAQITLISQLSNGDARTALNVLDYIRDKVSKENIKEAFQKSHLLYDKDGEEHYNIISALHKSMRASQPDAALYWLARMLEAGEDPLYIARRIIRFASEDIGLANSRALEQAISAYTACHYIGMPECALALAQAVVYMAKSKKSRAINDAYEKAVLAVKKHGNLPVPLSIRNAPTKLMKDLGYGKGEQEFLPEELKKEKFLD